MPNLVLSSPIEQVPYVGPSYAKKLDRLNIKTVEDLLWHFPFRYQDFSLISPIAQLQAGEIVTIKGQILQTINQFTRTGKKITLVRIADETGSIEAVFFNQLYLLKIFRPNTSWRFSGKVDWFGHKVILVSPEYEREGQALHTGRLVPVYPETEGVSSKWLRSRVNYVFKYCSHLLNEYFPYSILRNNDLMGLKQSIEQIHFSKNRKLLELARERLAFEELFLIQLASGTRKLRWQKEKKSKPIKIDQEKILQFINNLPFILTSSQNQALKEILSDLERPFSMNRLLEGDVGSGKTVVAAIAMYAAFLNGYQSALMAPTEILANQHYQTISTILSPLGVKVELITSSTTTNKKKVTVRARQLAGENSYQDFSLRSKNNLITDRQESNDNFDIAIGTHSLLYDKISFSNLALVVIDEQHRFGVEQRGQLFAKGNNPHLLTMTATPIPRTVALTLYGELDLSFLNEMPQGRQKIKTWVVPSEKRNSCYEWIKKQIKGNHDQCFIICPLIEESETIKTAKAAKVEFERLREIFKGFSLGLLHGRLKSKEKGEVVNSFRSQKIDILVATPVVEVGIDIPNATIMLIEAADRFGLAQLHQLRGRVGRSSKQSYCFLFTEIDNPPVFQRLKTLETHFIGAELAELDLKFRGPGELFGTKQHGFWQLKVASFDDQELIQKTKEEASKLLSDSPDLIKYPLLKERLEKIFPS